MQPNKMHGLPLTSPARFRTIPKLVIGGFRVSQPHRPSSISASSPLSPRAHQTWGRPVIQRPPRCDDLQPNATRCNIMQRQCNQMRHLLHHPLAPQPLSPQSLASIPRPRCSQMQRFLHSAPHVADARPMHPSPARSAELRRRGISTTREPALVQPITAKTRGRGSLFSASSRLQLNLSFTGLPRAGARRSWRCSCSRACRCRRPGSRCPAGTASARGRSG